MSNLFERLAMRSIGVGADDEPDQDAREARDFKQDKAPYSNSIKPLADALYDPWRSSTAKSRDAIASEAGLADVEMNVKLARQSTPSADALQPHRRPGESHADVTETVFNGNKSMITGRLVTRGDGGSKIAGAQLWPGHVDDRIDRRPRAAGDARKPEQPMSESDPAVAAGRIHISAEQSSQPRSSKITAGNKGGRARARRESSGSQTSDAFGRRTVKGSHYRTLQATEDRLVDPGSEPGQSDRSLVEEEAAARQLPARSSRTRPLAAGRADISAENKPNLAPDLAGQAQPLQVSVTIGRVEIRASAPVTKAGAESDTAEAAAALSLDDYLEQRDSGRL